jgi:hypothetical protein
MFKKGKFEYLTLQRKHFFNLWLLESNDYTFASLNFHMGNVFLPPAIDWVFVSVLPSPQNSWLKLYSQCDSMKTWDFGNRLDHEGGVLLCGISVLIKKTQRAPGSFWHVVTHGEDGCP